MYSIEDYDNHGVLKPGFFLIACTAYVARFLLFGPLSLVAGRAMRGREALDVSFLTDASPLEMLSSIPAVIILFIMLARKPNSPDWMKLMWKHARALLALSVSAQLIIVINRVFYGHELSLVEFIVGMVNAYLLVYFSLNNRPKAVFSMFPEKNETSTSN